MHHNVGMLIKASAMRPMVALNLILATASAFVVNSDESFCCRYASSNERCHDTCMEIYRTQDPVFLQRLEILFPMNCPKSDERLREFWNCFSGNNDTNGAWVGRRCCEQTVSDMCRSTCMQSNSRTDLSAHCRDDYEDALYKCVFREETRQSCCGKRNGIPGTCRHQCDISFRRETGPSPDDIAKVTKTCDVTMGHCMEEYVNATRQKSIVRLPCCDRAPAESCRQSCKKILRSETSDRGIVDRLVEACGFVMPHEPMWKCFLHNPPDPPEPSPSPPLLAELMCCEKAISDNCKQLCKRVYADPWPDRDMWEHFQNRCEYNTKEMELSRCLQEVRSPCKMGCSGLSFCSNFNNRPTALFRSCNAEGDAVAKESFMEWSDGSIPLLNERLPVKNIKQCEPEKWKAVACALQIKPCGSRSGESIICRSDCINLLNKCADKSRMKPNADIEEVCDYFSPSHLQSNCISLSTYTKPAQAFLKADVTQPCGSNPCSRGQVCVINRRTCHSEENCPKYSCLPGCKMGHGSDFIVPHGSLVRVPDSSRGDGCFKACTCASSGSLRHCTELPCTDTHANCKLAGQMKHHGDNFYVDCNFCSCYGGIVTCTKRQCSSGKRSEEEKRKFTGLPCNCPAFYAPVCGRNGQTVPSSCLASCLETTPDETHNGQCMKTNPCQPNPCPGKQRCIPTPRVCLTRVDQCQQYECMPRYRQCTRLLQNPVALIGRTSKQPRHVHRRYGRRNEVQEILASSQFFSNGAFVENHTLVCDASNQEFSNVCKLIRSKRRTLAYKGPCKRECSRDNSRPVCGHDRVTYNNSCMAEAEGVLVDHLGACKSVGLTDAARNAISCKGITCPALANHKCKAIRPPGSCCSLCGGMIRVILSKTHLDAVLEEAWKGPVTVRDIVWLLRSRLNVHECNLYGQLTMEGDLAILVVSTVNNPSMIQVDACSREAERLSQLINTRSPTLTSYLILSPLTASTLSTSDRPSGATSLFVTSQFGLMTALLTLLFWFVSGHTITS